MTSSETFFTTGKGRLTIVAILLAVLFSILFAFNYASRAFSNLNEATYLNGESFAQEAFSDFVAETPESNEAGPTPARVWRGATATVLAVSRNDRTYVRRLTVYAQTPKGAFFEVSYIVDPFKSLDQKGAKRLIQEAFRPLTPVEMKTALFEAKKFDEYKALFGTPPIEKIDA